MFVVYKDDKELVLPERLVATLTADKYREELIHKLKSEGKSPIVGKVYKDKERSEIKVRENGYITRWVICPQ